jgi:hypothetical protein
MEAGGKQGVSLFAAIAAKSIVCPVRMKRIRALQNRKATMKSALTTIQVPTF